MLSSNKNCYYFSWVNKLERKVGYDSDFGLCFFTFSRKLSKTFKKSFSENGCVKVHTLNQFFFVKCSTGKSNFFQRPSSLSTSHFIKQVWPPNFHWRLPFQRSSYSVCVCCGYLTFILITVPSVVSWPGPHPLIDSLRTSENLPFLSTLYPLARQLLIVSP